MRTLILAVLLLLSVAAFAQPDLIPYRRGVHWGYADATGKVVIEPRWDRTWFFSSEGLARVRRDGRYGFIGRDGRIVVEEKFTGAADFYLGTARVSSGNRTYCINTEGVEEECSFEDDDFTEEREEPPVPPMEVFGDADGKGILLQSGDTVAGRFDSVGLVSKYFFPQYNHFAIVKEDGRYGAINQQGATIASPEFEAIDILDMHTFRARRKGKWGVRYFDGTVALPFQYEAVEKVTEVLMPPEGVRKKELFIVRRKGLYGIVDDRNQTVAKAVFETILVPEACACPLEFVVRQNGLIGLLDGSGKVIVPLKYSYVEPFRTSTLTLVRTTAGREGYVGRNGLEYFSD